jgi:Protein of unknown function (DUF1769)
MATSPDKYFLKVTAGSTYTTHTPVPINSHKPLTIESPAATVQIVVNIRDFRGPPSSNAPSTAPYFEAPSRKSARYSIAFRVIPKKRISGDALILGNDFDQPITKFLPPFFGTALQVVKRLLDPGIDGDPYGQKPYLYGPVLSSVNILKVTKESDQNFGEDVVTECAKGEEAEKLWKDTRIPKDASGRSKFFLHKDNRKKFDFEEGWCYDFDFFNGYLDFNGMNLIQPRNCVDETRLYVEVANGHKFQHPRTGWFS